MQKIYLESIAYLGMIFLKIGTAFILKKKWKNTQAYKNQAHKKSLLKVRVCI